MGKALENKLKKLLQSTKPEKLARQWKNYMKDAYNEYYDNYNKEYSLKLLENGVKFLEENKHKSFTFIKESLEVQAHEYKLLYKEQIKSYKTIREQKLGLNEIELSNLINYWHIKTLITKYLATRDDNILKKVLGLTNNQIKIISENTDNDLLNEILEEHLNTDEFLKD